MIIDGKALAQKIYLEISNKATNPLKLAIILANNDESSKKYTELKKAAGEKIGINVDIYKFDEKITKEDLILKISELNNDISVNGIVVQLPLFSHLNDFTTEILDTLSPKKDADGLTSTSLATAFNFSENSIMPAAVEAIMISLSEVEDLKNLKGKNILIINNSNLVGNPLAVALSKLNATVTIANEFTQNLNKLTLNADIIITATGVTNIIKADDIKNGAILIDVTSVNKDGKVYGDFIFDESLINKAKAYTPVPGGIGPLTVASLFKNLIKLSNGR